jgi:hypothetical protein
MTAAPAPTTPSWAAPPLVHALAVRILRFHELLSGHAFYTYQYVFSYRIIEALLTDDDAERLGSTITGLWSRQSGKTSCVAELIVTLAVILPVLAKLLPQVECLQKFKDGLKVGIFAPIDPQAKLSYDKMRDLIAQERAKAVLADPGVNVSILVSRGDQLTFANGSVVVAKTASPDSSIEGISGLHIILIDEAQNVDPFKVDKEIEPMRAATNGIMVKIGTASVTRGGFREDIEANIAAFRAGLAPRNHFEFDYAQVIRVKMEMYKKTGQKIHLAYSRYVEGKKKLMGGEKSVAFRMNFMLKWQESRMDAVSDRSLAAAKEVHRTLNVEYPRADNTVRVAGIDVAKGTHDPTVVTINEFNPDDPILIDDPVTGDIIKLYHHTIIAIKEFEGNFEDLLQTGESGQYTGIVEFLRRWDVIRVTTDATGMGDPVFQRFQVLASDIDWEPYRYTMQTKSDLFKYYLQEFEGERVHVYAGDMELPQCEKFFREHKTLQKSVVGDAKQHIDYPNSAALAVWCTRTELMMEIQSQAASGGYTRGHSHRPSAQQRYGGRR